MQCNWQGSRLEFLEFDTGLGRTLLAADEQGLVLLSFQDGLDPVWPLPGWRQNPVRLDAWAQAVRVYLGGEKRLPDAPLGSLPGTAFQRAAWQALRGIPFGETRTYGDIAAALGRPGASRAVGAACGANPLPLFIPCHRVLGRGGALTGFSCGIAIKRRLLEIEGIRSMEMSPN